MAITSPRDITGLYAWYDATQMALVNNASVSSWTDMSGNNRHATQGTAAQQPAFKTNHTANGNPAIWFDGSYKFLSFTRLTSVRALFIVLYEQLGATGERFFIGDSVEGNYAFHRATGVNGPIIAPDNYWSTDHDALKVSPWTMNGASINPTTTKMPTELSILSVRPNVTTITAAQLSKDRTQTTRSWFGAMGEVIIYNQPITQQNHDDVITYLTGKWFGVPAPTPIATQKIQVSSGIKTIPIYNIADVTESALRVQTSAGLGAYNLVTPSASTPLRVSTSKGIRGIETL